MTVDIASLVSGNLDIWTTAVERKSGAGRGGGKRINLYGIDRLRELILDLAVRGKLVAQDAGDESASELLKKIRADRARLTKAGAIGKRKAAESNSDDAPYPIPEGWVWTRIADIGHDWGQKEPSSDFTYVDVGSIDQRAGIIRSPSVLSAGEAPSRARKVVKVGTVIYSTVRPYLLNIAIVDQDFDPEPIASTAFAIVHPFEGVTAGFLYRYLRSATFISYVEDCQTGIAYPAINDKQFFSAWFPLPPFAEQQRIVAKVDELMSLCDALAAESAEAMAAHQSLVEALLATLIDSTDATDLAANWARLEAHFDTLFTTETSVDALKQTILELAVRGKLVSPEKLNTWTEYKLGEVISPMDSGWSPACHPFPTRAPEAWGVLKTTAVQKLEYQSDQNKELPENLAPRPDAECRVGDILITRAGPTNRVGICCYVNATPPRLMISDKIVRFRPATDQLDGAFLALALSVGPSAAQIEKAKSGMAASQVNISQAKLRQVMISFPHLDEQRQIIAKVDELMAFCDTLKSQIWDAANTQMHLANAVIERAAA